MTRLKIEELESPFGQVKGLEIYIRKIGHEEEWEEPMGPHPMPNVVDLREWDFKLLKRYRPMYAPMYDTCAKCTFGKCDLTAGAKGACGIDIRCNQARTGLAQAVEGCAAHSWHSRHLLSELIEKYGPETPIDMGERVQIEAPLIRLIMGFKPKTISDLEVVLDYIEKNLTSLSSAVLPWQEGSYLDFESKQLHAGMLDLLGMEVGDIAQISAMNLAKGDPNAPLVDIGIGTIDTEKPVILCFGHNISPGASVMDYLHKSSLYEEVEVGGICCSAHDITRYDSGAKVVGNLGRQLQILRSGIADVIVVDMQCIKTNMLEEAEKIGARVIATTDNVCYGLRNRTKDDPDEIVSDLLKGEIGALIIDRDKIGEVAVKTAIKIAKTRPQKKKMSLDLDEMVEICTLCGLCNKECHYNLDIKKAFEEAKNGNLSLLQNLYFLCVSCGRCENVCPKEIPIVSVYTKVAQPRFSEIRSKVRSGRGPIQDVEIRNVGRPIVFGEIPGVIAFVGCPNYTPDYETGLRDQIEVAKIFLERNYIVVASGCAALDLAMYKDEDGYLVYQGRDDDM
ncbi:MAG: 4Fe-4S dicluster domain-containing protein, partial [Candidatus Methanofastidiosia archaeon]